MGIFDRLRALFRGAAPNGSGAATDGTAGAASDAISCHEALAAVNEYLDGELEGVPEREVKAHLDKCRQCYPHLHLETVCRAAIRRAAGGATAPPGLKERIAELLAEADADG